MQMLYPGLEFQPPLFLVLSNPSVPQALHSHSLTATATLIQLSWCLVKPVEKTIMFFQYVITVLPYTATFFALYPLWDSSHLTQCFPVKLDKLFLGIDTVPIHIIQHGSFHTVLYVLLSSPQDKSHHSECSMLPHHTA